MVHFTDGKYILDEEGNVKEENDLLKWAKWFEENNAQRRVANTEVGEYVVSTVFLAMDYSFQDGAPPVLWETMVFKKEPEETEIFGRSVKVRPTVDDYFERYTSKEDAVVGHERIIQQIKTDKGI